MNTAEIISKIMEIPGATMGRANKTNFIVVPTEDGYSKVSVTAALAKDTKNHSAFNYEAAVAEYKAWEAEAALRAAERANKPVKVKGPNPEAEARRQALDAAITALPSFTNATATDVFNMFVEGEQPKTVMLVGSALKRLVEAGVVVATKSEDAKDKKTYYTKA
jgi:hypothetical protein